MRVDSSFSRRFLIAALALALPAALVFSIKYGAVPTDWHDLWAAFAPGGDARDPAMRTILLEIRLPRLLLVVVVGASLALSGAVMQGLLRNPLADPALLGVSSGGALAAVVAIVAGLAPSASVVGAFALPAVTFIGGLLAALLVYRIARRGGVTDAPVLLLAGIAVNALAAAGIGFFTLIASDAELRGFIFWMLGSFSGADYPQLLPTAVFALPAIVALLFLSRTLNALSLGDDDAVYLGFDVERVKHIGIACTALCVSASVAVAGIIAFVGLLAPHLLRLVIGPDHRRLLPGSALAGALLLLLADNVARTALQPAELPIGILTAALGVPFFILLIWTRISTRLNAG